MRVPRDGFDLKIAPLQEEERLVPLTTVTAELKSLLQARGQEEILKEGITYIPLDNAHDGLAEELSSFAQESGLEVGIAIAGNGKYAYDIFTYAERGGERFRVLKIPDSFDMSSQDFLAEANKIFVPSEGVDTESGRFMLMPMLEEIEHPEDVTQEEIDDFTDRMRSSRIVPSLDLGMRVDEATGKHFPEANLVRLNGKLYICDAGDLLHGNLDGDKEKVVAVAESALQERLVA